MSTERAAALLDKMETDEAFLAELTAVNSDPAAVLAKAREAGFDTTPEELKQVVLERYGSELSTEQLDQIAAGYSPGEIGAMVGGSVVLAAVLVGIGAAML